MIKLLTGELTLKYWQWFLIAIVGQILGQFFKGVFTGLGF